MYKVTLRGVRITTFAVEKQELLRILSVGLWPQLSSTQSACAVLYYHLRPVRLYNIFPHYLIKGTIFGKKSCRKQNCVLIFSANFASDISHFK